MYSQRDEEIHIERFWRGRTGRFLDVGAYDGKTFSNTRLLAERGWSGVLMEPSPSLWKPLEDMYGGNPNFIVLKEALGLTNAILPFYDFGGDAVSSLDLHHAELWKIKGERDYEILNVQAITWQQLLDQVGNDFDFLNLDAEAVSVDLLKVMPFDRLVKLKMICVEFDHREPEVLGSVSPHGFALIHKTAENMILVR